MSISVKITNSTNPSNPDPESQAFTRKPYHKNGKYQSSNPDKKPEYAPLQLPQIAQKDPNPAQTCKNRSSLDNKIASLIELGLNPDLSPQKKTRFKLNRKNTIMLTDFMKKSVQKQILSFHNLNDIKTEETDSMVKEKVPKSFSFIRTGSLSLRKSQSIQTLPPIFRDSDKLNDNFKLTRDDKLKKIDQIMDSCTELLKSSKKKLNCLTKASL